MGAMFLPREPILTRRLRLEPVAPSHAEPLWEAIDASLPELRPWMGWAQNVSLESTREFAAGAEQRWDFDVALEYVVFAAQEQSSPLGTVGLHLKHNLPRSDIGYWMRSDHTRRGYTTEAASALLDLAFTTLGNFRVELRAGAANIASRRVAEKLGFRQEGRLRAACLGAYGMYDCYIYGLLATDSRP